MIDRILGALRLNPHTFEEVEADTSATKQAALVVIIVAIATGIGGIGGGPLGFIMGIVSGLIFWAAWAFLTFIIGTTILKTPETHANWSQLARATGFAQAPGILKLFGFIPVLGGIIVFIASVWQLVAMVIAVRHALDYTSTIRAVAVVIIGWIVVMIIVGLFAVTFGGALIAAGGP